MGTARILSTMNAVVLLSLPALAGAPINGIYHPIDGRTSESWANGQGKHVGNIIHASSWDGSTLGARWRFYGMELSSLSTSPATSLPGGYYSITFTSSYTGGRFELKSTGSWGDEDYSGDITSYLDVTTCTYDPDGNVVGNTSNWVLTGRFDIPYDYFHIRFAIGNIAGLGSTVDGSMIPQDYPGFLPYNRTEGEWGDVTGITMDIFGTVPAGESSWGMIKYQYR